MRFMLIKNKKTPHQFCPQEIKSRRIIIDRKSLSELLFIIISFNIPVDEHPKYVLFNAAGFRHLSINIQCIIDDSKHICVSFPFLS